MVLRCDASASIGGGHLVRCATLATVLIARGWRCRFLVSHTTRRFAGHLLPAQAEVVEIPDRLASDGEASIRALATPVDWLVVDHYGLSAAFERAMRECSRRVAVIDDGPRLEHDCDLLLDQNLGCVERDYRPLVPQGCELLLGPAFALLRDEYSRLRRDRLRRRVFPRSAQPRVLVSAGYSDPAGVTLLALDALALAAPAARVEIILGSGSPVLAEVRRRLRGCAQEVVLHVEPDDPAAIAAGCDIAVGAGGGSAWERCCLGLPAVLVTMAVNQIPVARALHCAGAARWLGDVQRVRYSRLARVLRVMLHSPVLLARMAGRARALCDGKGAQRVALSLERLAFG